jgi:glycosyltransferase involved in cell wall biosynthesis
VARARGVNVIHARSRAPGWSALIAARRLGLAFVTTYHGIYNAKSPLKRLYNSVMARGDIVIANSEYTRAHVLAEHGLAPERVVAIPRGVDVESFDRARLAPGAIAAMRDSWGLGAAAGLVLILPARLTRWKGQGVLIDALALLQTRRPGAVSAVLAGDAQGRQAYVNELQARIDSAGLRARVAMVGHVREIALALAAADAAVLPSIEPEAFGRGAVEAQALGLPVIAAAHGGLAETIRDGDTGFLVEPGSPDALAAAIERLLDIGPEGRSAMGAKGAARVRQHYSKAALQAATLAVYDHVLGARK